MDNTNQATQAGNMGKETDLQGAAGKENGQRLFTQEEVNSLIQARVSRVKGQVSRDSQAEYEQKLADLQAREMKLLVREKLDERKMPRELADIITCTDEEDLTKKLDAIQKIYGSNAREESKPQGFIRVGAASGGYSGADGSDPVRKAMGLG